MARPKKAAPPFAWVLGSMKEACGSSLKGALSLAATSLNNTDVKEGQRTSCPSCGGSGRRESDKGQRGDGKAPCWFCEGYGILPVSDLEGYVMTGAVCIDINESRAVNAGSLKTATAVHAALAAAAPLPSKRGLNSVLPPSPSNETSPGSGGKSSSGRRRRRPSIQLASSNPALALPVRSLSFDPTQISESQARVRCPWLMVEDAKEVAANSRRIQEAAQARHAQRQLLRSGAASDSAKALSPAKSLSPIKSPMANSPSLNRKSPARGLFSNVLDGHKMTEAVTGVLSKLTRQQQRLTGADGSPDMARRTSDDGGWVASPRSPMRLTVTATKG